MKINDLFDSRSLSLSLAYSELTQITKTEQECNQNFKGAKVQSEKKDAIYSLQHISFYFCFTYLMFYKRLFFTFNNS